jgi:ABC-type Mn2+/Zn2+ transport system ATPase subunit
MSKAPLEIRSLNVAYHRKMVLWDADLSIRPGRSTAIVGTNGAGKSTLLNDALGLIAQCEDEGVWPGYAPEVQCLNLPSWVYGKGAA